MKIRVKFSKTGVVKYIGHLDFMRYFQKAFRRTDIRVLYSKGFNPHMIMSFAQPLGVGVQSYGDYFDVEVEDDEIIETMKDKLNAQMAEGVEVLDIIKLPENSINAMASVAAAGYDIVFLNKAPVTKEMLDKFMSSEEVLFTKETKKSETTFNVLEFFFGGKVLDDGTLYMLVDASSAGNLKPQAALEAILKLNDLDIKDYPFHIYRKDLYQRKSDGTLVTLGEF